MSNTTDNPLSVTNLTTQVNGTAVKGIVKNGTVSAYGAINGKKDITPLAIGSTDNQGNSSGLLEISPIIEGNILTYKQELIKNYKGTIAFSHGDHYEYFSTLFQNKMFSHHHFGVQKNIDDHQSIRVAWHTNLNSFEIGYKTKLTTLKFVTDSLSSQKRHSLSFSAGISYLF